MNSMKDDSMFINFKTWLLLGLMATSNIAFADVLNELTPSTVPLPATVWLILISIIGFLAIRKRRND